MNNTLNMWYSEAALVDPSKQKSYSNYEREIYLVMKRSPALEGLHLQVSDNT